MGRWGVRFGLDCLVVVVVEWCLGGVMVLGMSSLCHDVGFGYGVCSLVGVFYSLFVGCSMLNGVHVKWVSY